MRTECQATEIIRNQSVKSNRSLSRWNVHYLQIGRCSAIPLRERSHWQNWKRLQHTDTSLALIESGVCCSCVDNVVRRADTDILLPATDFLCRCHRTSRSRQPIWLYRMRHSICVWWKKYQSLSMNVNLMFSIQFHCARSLSLSPQTKNTHIHLNTAARLSSLKDKSASMVKRKRHTKNEIKTYLR